MHLLWDNKQITTNQITTIFKKGKPFLLKVIFIFKNEKEWFNFFKFYEFLFKRNRSFFTESPLTL